MALSRQPGGHRLAEARATGRRALAIAVQNPLQLLLKVLEILKSSARISVVAKFFRDHRAKRLHQRYAPCIQN